MKKILVFKMSIISLLITGLITPAVMAGDLDDDISKYKDDSIKADDELGKPDTNINFIVVDAIGDAKAQQYQANKNQNPDASSGQNQNSHINYNDGSGENNQNSIVVGTGSQVDKVININVGK